MNNLMHTITAYTKTIIFGAIIAHKNLIKIYYSFHIIDVNVYNIISS